MKPSKRLATLCVLAASAATGARHCMGNDEVAMVRLSRLVIASAALVDYKAALADEIKASLAQEPGVRTLYAVFEKENPTHLTILEIYADKAAYEAHLRSPHFLKYKVGTQRMVTSLELVDVEPLIPSMTVN